MAESWIKEPCMMGIDEAGRGPVLGAMVYACAYCPISFSDDLKTRGFADSKTLTEEKRENLLDKIDAEPNVGYASDILTAADISAKMLAREVVSLNVLAAESTYRVIESVLNKGVNVTEIYVDTVGDAGRYQEKLSQRFPGIKFTVCPKADAIYPIVSAASIVAKVTRDRLLKNYQPVEDIDVSREYGSGYPGDAVTKQWLESHIDSIFGFPSLVRFSWGTCDPLLKEKAIDVKWECDEGDATQQTLTFGGSQKNNGAASSGTGRHSFFRARKLQRVVSSF